MTIEKPKKGKFDSAKSNKFDKPVEKSKVINISKFNREKKKFRKQKVRISQILTIFSGKSANTLPK